MERGTFEAYLCQRYAFDWIETRGMLRLFEKGEFPGIQGRIEADLGKVMDARCMLARALSRGREGELRQLLLSIGWGEVRLHDELRLRIIVSRLAKRGMPDLKGGFPVLPASLEDLEEGPRNALKRFFSGDSLVHSLGEAGEAERTLLLFKGKPLVELEEVKPDVLGAITESERASALREFYLMKLCGKIFRFPSKRISKPVFGAWLKALKNHMMDKGAAIPERIERQAEGIAGTSIEADFILLPALRPGSGRPGHRLDFVFSRKRAERLIGELVDGLPLGAALKRAREGFGRGLGLAKIHKLESLSGKWIDYDDLRRTLDFTVSFLGFCFDFKKRVLLLEKTRKWYIVPSPWGYVLVRVNRKRKKKVPLPCIKDDEMEMFMVERLKEYLAGRPAKGNGRGAG